MNNAEESQSEEELPNDEGGCVNGDKNSSSSSLSAWSGNDDNVSCNSNSADESDDESLNNFDVDDSLESFEEFHLQGIKNDNPRLLSLNIGSSEIFCYNWQRLGNDIGNNIHLEKLRVCHLSSPFCQGIARNRHLRMLAIVNIHPPSGEFFAALAPLFQHNRRLRCLSILECDCFRDNYSGHSTSAKAKERANNSVRALASALSKCDKYSLREINLCENKLRDDHAAKLIGKMDRYANLYKLNLESNQIGMKGCIALARLLENPRSKLTDVYLAGNQIDDDCMIVLAKAFKKNTSVKTISFGMLGRAVTNPITVKGWGVFSEVLSTTANSLEKIFLHGTNLGDESTHMLATSAIGSTTLKLLDIGCCRSIGPAGWHSISNFLQNYSPGLSVLDVRDCSFDDTTALEMANALAEHKALKCLDMGENKGITSHGWQAFFRVYPNSESSLESLRVPTNTIDDTGLATLVRTLTSTSLFKKLDIQGNHLISTDGLRGLLNLLQHPRCKLTGLVLDNDNVDEDILLQYANALTGNDSLKSLSIGTCGLFDSARVYDAFSNLLCDKSTIDATYNSNHTLEDLDGLLLTFKEGRDEVNDYLSMHRIVRRSGCRKSESARMKVFENHFSRGHGNIHVFSDMKLKVLPQAINWIGKNHDGVSLMYQVVHAVPSLFDFELGARPKLSGTKRKPEN